MMTQSIGIKDVRELERSDAYQDLEMPGIDLALVYRLDIHTLDVCEQSNPNSVSRGYVALVNEDTRLSVRISDRFSVIGCSEDAIYPPDYSSAFQKRSPADITQLLRRSFERVLGPQVCLGDLTTIDRDPNESPIYRVQCGYGNGQIFTIASLIEPIPQPKRTRAALRCLGATGDLENGTHVIWNAARPLEEKQELVIHPELIGPANKKLAHVVTGLLPEGVPEEDFNALYPLTSIAEEVFKKLSEAGTIA